jgi:hypothetical protein
MRRPAPLLKIRSNPRLQRALREKIRSRLRARRSENPDWVDLAKITIRGSLKQLSVVDRAQFRWLERHFERGRAPGLSLMVQTARSVVQSWRSLVKKKAT